MDKYVFYTTMKENGLPVIHKDLVNPNKKASFEGPYILKPRFGGSSIGVEVVNDYESVLKIIDSSDLYTGVGSAGIKVSISVSSSHNV